MGHPLPCTDLGWDDSPQDPGGRSAGGRDRVAVAVTTALAGVTVYKNTFTHKGDAKELRHAEGKHCNRKFRKKAKNLQINVTKSPDACGYRPPVEGDTDGPDHNFQAKARFLQEHAEGPSGARPT